MELTCYAKEKETFIEMEMDVDWEKCFLCQNVSFFIPYFFLHSYVT